MCFGCRDRLIDFLMRTDGGYTVSFGWLADKDTSRGRKVMLLRIVLGRKCVDTPTTIVVYLAHKPCTAFAGHDIGEPIIKTLTDFKGLNLAKEFIFASFHAL